MHKKGGAGAFACQRRAQLACLSLFATNPTPSDTFPHFSTLFVFCFGFAPRLFGFVPSKYHTATAPSAIQSCTVCTTCIKKVRQALSLANGECSSPAYPLRQLFAANSTLLDKCRRFLYFVWLCSETFWVRSVQKPYSYRARGDPIVHSMHKKVGQALSPANGERSSPAYPLRQIFATNPTLSDTFCSFWLCSETFWVRSVQKPFAPQLPTAPEAILEGAPATGATLLLRGRLALYCNEWSLMERRPKAVSIVAAVLFAATVIATVLGSSLLYPSARSERLWALNAPVAMAFHKWGSLAGLLLLLLGGTTLSAAVGLLQRKQWAWRLAVALFGINAFGDMVSLAVTGDWWRGISGIAICCAFLYDLSRYPVRRYFKRDEGS